jgi:hypothetical protein
VNRERINNACSHSSDLSEQLKIVSNNIHTLLPKISTKETAAPFHLS